jgi:hypothetical protein
MNLLQKAYKYLRLRAILNSLKGVPIINLILFRKKFIIQLNLIDLQYQEFY